MPTQTPQPPPEPTPDPKEKKKKKRVHPLLWGCYGHYCGYRRLNLDGAGFPPNCPLHGATMRRVRDVLRRKRRRLRL